MAAARRPGVLLLISRGQSTGRSARWPRRGGPGFCFFFRLGRVRGKSARWPLGRRRGLRFFLPPGILVSTGRLLRGARGFRFFRTAGAVSLGKYAAAPPELAARRRGFRFYRPGGALASTGRLAPPGSLRRARGSASSGPPEYWQVRGAPLRAPVALAGRCAAAGVPLLLSR